MTFADPEDIAYAAWVDQEREAAREQWEAEVAEDYAAYVADCEADGVEPLDLDEWDEERCEAALAEAD